MSRIKTKITDCHNGPQNKHREPCKMANRTEGQFLVLSGPHTKLPWPSQWPSKDSQTLYTTLAPSVALSTLNRSGPQCGPLRYT